MDNSTRNYSTMPTLVNWFVNPRRCASDSSPSMEIKTTSYVLLLLLSFIANVIVIDIIRRNQHLRSTIDILVVHMCVSDIGTTLFGIPHRVRLIHVGFLWFDGLFGAILCKFEEFALGACHVVSVLTMTAMAIERFQCVCRATKTTNVWSKIRRLFTVIVWCVAVIVFSTAFDSKEVVREPDTRVYCTYRWRPDQWKIFYSALLVMFVVVPLFLISVLYTAVVISLRRQKARIANHLTFQALRRRVKQNRKITFMLLTVVVVNVAAYIPLGVSFMYFLFDVQEPIKLCSTHFLAMFLMNSVSALNPAVFLAFNDKYRQELKQLLRCMIPYLQRRARRKAPINQPHNKPCAVVQARDNEAVQIEETGQVQ